MDVDEKKRREKAASRRLSRRREPGSRSLTRSERPRGRCGNAERVVSESRSTELERPSERGHSTIARI